MSERVSGEGDGVAASLFLRCVRCMEYGLQDYGTRITEQCDL